MKIKHKIMFISLILLVLFSITCVSATQDLDDKAVTASEINLDEVSSSSDNDIQGIESDSADGEKLSMSKDSQVNNSSIKAANDNAASGKAAVKEDAVIYTANRTVPVKESSSGYGYLVILKDANNKALSGKTVTLSFNGKTYSKTTDSRGWANFTLKCNKEGTYKVQASFAGDNSYKSISSNSVLKLIKEAAVIYVASRTVTVSECSSGYGYLVILKDGDKRALSGKTVTLSFNGKTYSKTTDNRGWANFTLKCNKEGTYKVVATFKGDNSYKSVSGNAAIKLVKEVSVIYIASRSYPVRDFSGGYGYLVILKDANKKALYGKTVKLVFNGNAYYEKTDNRGWANFVLKCNAEGTYNVVASFNGDNCYTPISGKAVIMLYREDSVLYIASRSASITDSSKGYDYLIILKDANKVALAGKTINLKFNGKTYSKTTDNRGWANFVLKCSAGTYDVEGSFKGDKFYKPSSGKATVKIFVPKSSSIIIGNTHLLTNGFLRVYLRSDDFQSVAKKTLTITIGTKTFTKVTNSEGIVSFSPKMAKNTYLVKVKFNGTADLLASGTSKNVQCISGNVINPLFNNVPTNNGVPDVDYMPGTFVTADGGMTYTVVKSEYLNVMQRDSYCLYLHNKLTKYTLFKSKAEPSFYHLIHRTKWNVIEREINTRVVLKNQYNYWPDEVTVSLKDKAYTYSEVRDVQNTGYTCGPTSASMCTQALRHYVNEAQLAQKAGSTASAGSSTSGLKRALEGYNMKCEVYYKSSFDHALNELKKGGCALIFHTWNHYVCILDISADGKKVLVGNPSGDYDRGSHSIPTNWLTVDYMRGMFNNYDTSGLIVKLNYSLNQKTTNDINQFYKNMGSWTKQNTNERIPQV